MKTTMRMMAMGMMYILLAASFAAADDPSISIDNKNKNDNTNNVNVNTNADANSNQNQNQKQKQNQNQQATSTIRGNLPTVGFNGFMASGIAEKGKWELLCSEVYKGWTLDDIENARDKFTLGDFFTFNWGSNAEFTLVGKPLPENKCPVSCLDYWPRTEARKGDRILGAVTITGKAGTPDEAFIAQAYNVCKKETGSSRVAMLIGSINENVTVGASFNISGALSKLSGGGDSGNAVASGIGIGKARVRSEESIIVAALCMNDRIAYNPPPPVYVPPQPAPAPPPPVVVTPAPPVCDPQQFLQQIKIWEEACFHCKNPCFNNEKLRKSMGDEYAALYHCTGNQEYLYMAIVEYDIALRDFSNGHEPDGVRTSSMKGAQIIAFMIKYNKSWIIRELYSSHEQREFARQNKSAFVKEDGRIAVPSCYEDLKH